MDTRTSIIVTFLILPILLSGQNELSTELIRETQHSVCAIKIYSHSPEAGTGISVGCGVVLMSPVDGNNTYFVATANHILEGLFKDDKAHAEIMVFDKVGMLYKTTAVTKEHVLWRNEELDAALVLLPLDLRPEGQIPMGYKYTGLAHLKMIGQPDWGEDIYLFGYRWVSEEFFIDILKKGILSVGTTQLPGYKEQLVFLIDNMANKGMSGGLAFTSEGTGIGIISSYVYETGSNLQNSDDLTVCLPLTFYFDALGEVVEAKKSKILQISDL